MRIKSRKIKMFGHVQLRPISKPIRNDKIIATRSKGTRGRTKGAWMERNKKDIIVVHSYQEEPRCAGNVQLRPISKPINND